jgi:hypothetical protein
MKKLNSYLLIGLTVVMASCADKKDRYIDLRTGQTIQVEKDSSGAWVVADTKKPVYIYVDTEKNDTIYGKTGEVINGHVVKGEDNLYWYDSDVRNNDAGTNEAESGEYKKKVEGDGDIKIKTEDQTIKIDGETGEKKVKDN